jgi:integrase
MALVRSFSGSDVQFAISDRNWTRTSTPVKPEQLGRRVMRRSLSPFHQRGEIFYCFLSDESGRRREKSLHTKNIDDAQKEYDQLKDDLRLGLAPNDLTEGTLRQAIDYWIDHRRYRVARGTLNSERSIVKHFSAVWGDGAKLRSLADIGHIQYYQNVRLKEGIAPKTINNELLVFSGILQLSQLWHRLEPRYRPLRAVRSDIGDALAREEVYRVLTLAREADPNAVVPFATVLSYATGMRSGEIKGLQIGSIQLGSLRPQIRVRRATTKTNQGARHVALDTMGVWAIRRLLDRASTLGATECDHYVLPTRLDRHTRTSDPLHGGSGWDPLHPQSSWEKEWRVFRQQAHIEHRRFHDLRHSFITRAAECGVALMVVQSQVGHMSTAMVEHYCHISQAAVHKAAELMEQQNGDLLRQLGLADSFSAFAHKSRSVVLE